MPWSWVHSGTIYALLSVNRGVKHGKNLLASYFLFVWCVKWSGEIQTVCQFLSAVHFEFWDTKYVNKGKFSLKYTLLLYIQEEDQEERGIVGAHRLLYLISTSGVIQGSNLWQPVTQKQLTCEISAFCSKLLCTKQCANGVCLCVCKIIVCVCNRNSRWDCI